jgi:hypothetical protein
MTFKGTMAKKKVVRASNAAVAGGLGLFGAAHAFELPPELVSLSEPIGLIFALIGAVLKVVEYYQARQK